MTRLESVSPVPKAMWNPAPGLTWVGSCLILLLIMAW